jgi:hypothetical protein
MRPAAFLLFISCAISISSCDFWDGERVKGNGVSANQQRQVGNFDGISVMGGMDIIVSSGQNSLKIEADQNLLEYIETRNNGGTIEVYTKEGYNLDPRSGIKIYATAPSFDELHVSGSGKISSQGKITGSSVLHTEISGSGDILMEADAPKIETEISGSGSSSIKGTTKDFSVRISGSGNVHCFDLLSENTEIDIAGSGNAEVYASKSLDVDIAGAGDVRYKGNPSIKQNTSGSGDIRKVD